LDSEPIGPPSEGAAAHSRLIRLIPELIASLRLLGLGLLRVCLCLGSNPGAERNKGQGKTNGWHGPHSTTPHIRRASEIAQ